MSNIKIREKQDSDASALAAALVAVHENDGYPVEGVENPEAWLADGEHLAAWTATDDGRPVGHVAVTRPAPTDAAAQLLVENGGALLDDIAVLGRLFVSPNARGHGLGRRLTETAMEMAQTSGWRLVLEVMIKDRRAIEVYENLGWVSLGDFSHTYNINESEPARAYALPA